MDDEPVEFKRQRAFLVETAPLLAEDFLRVARESRQARAEKDTALADDISHIWARGWTVVDAVINSMEQSAALMFPRSEAEDAHSHARSAVAPPMCGNADTKGGS